MQCEEKEIFIRIHTALNNFSIESFSILDGYQRCFLTRHVWNAFLAPVILCVFSSEAVDTEEEASHCFTSSVNILVSIILRRMETKNFHRT